MRLRFVPPLLALLALAACSHNMVPSSTGDAGTAPTPSFNQFTDVPIPDGARMDADRTLLLGNGDAWVGRLVFNVRWSNAPEMFDFYKAEMPNYKWQEVTSVRAAISVMTYQRADRIATIQIEETTLGVEVILTMGPVNGQGGAGSGASAGQPPAAVAAPAPMVTTQPLK